MKYKQVLIEFNLVGPMIPEHFNKQTEKKENLYRARSLIQVMPDLNYLDLYLDLKKINLNDN